MIGYVTLASKSRRRQAFTQNYWAKWAPPPCLKWTESHFLARHDQPHARRVRAV